jgi:hypothetical protein
MLLIVCTLMLRLLLHAVVIELMAAFTPLVKAPLTAARDHLTLRARAFRSIVD